MNKTIICMLIIWVIALITLVSAKPIIVNTEAAGRLEITNRESTYVINNPEEVVEFNPQHKGKYTIRLFFEDRIKEYIVNVKEKELHKEKDKPNIKELLNELSIKNETNVALFSKSQQNTLGLWCGQVYEELKEIYRTPNGYNPKYDLVPDLELDLRDISIIAIHMFQDGEPWCESKINFAEEEVTKEYQGWIDEFETNTSTNVTNITITNEGFSLDVNNQEVELEINVTNLANIVRITVLEVNTAILGTITKVVNTPLVYVDATGASGSLALKKTGAVSAILKCNNISGNNCLDWSMSNISFVDNGTHVLFNTNGFSGYAGAQIEIINVKSVPTVGGLWSVRFRTEGTANLTIEAVEGTTWATDNNNEDLRFLSLKCGETERSYQWISDTVFIQDYNCTENSLETSRVITQGKHVLKFTFGNGVGYAYNNASQDFKIQRGSTIIPTSSDTITIVAGTDYEAPISSNRSFIRITGTRLTGIGDTTTGGTTQDPGEYMAIITDSWNIVNNITFERGTSPAAYNTKIYYEIIEYIGRTGGDNEIIVRDHGVVVHTAGATVDGSSSSAIDDGDVVVFITGQRHDAATAGTTDRGVYTAQWLGATDTPRFTRDDGTGTSKVSYSVVEFIGQNWLVQMINHTQTATGPQTEIMPVTLTNISRAFLHTQVRTNSGNLDEIGVIAWISASNILSFSRESEATGTQNVVTWVVENFEATGTPMKVQQISGTRGTGGPEPDTWVENINEIISINMTSIIGETDHSNGGGTATPRGSIGLNITGLTNVTLWQSDSGQAQVYRFMVVEWPGEIVNYGPNVSLVIPPDKTNLSNTSVDFVFNTTDDYSGELNCTLYGNFTGIWKANKSLSIVAQDTNTNITIDVVDGNYVWNVVCQDFYGATNSSMMNFSLRIDQIFPSITGVNATDITASSTIIIWNTSELSNSTINYGLTTNLGNYKSSTEFTFTHSVAVNALNTSIQYYYNVTSCDYVGNCNTSGPHTFNTSSILDTTPPGIFNVSNSSLETTAVINWTTNESANSSVNYGLTTNLGNYKTSTLFKTIHSLILSDLTPIKYYYYNITSCDASGNCKTNGTFYFSTIDVTLPDVTLNYPDNNTLVPRGDLDFNFTPVDNGELSNCTLFHNISGTWEQNITLNNPVNGSVNNITIFVPLGNYIYNVLCYDTGNNTNWAAANYSFTAVDFPPEVKLIAPLNNYETNNQSVNLTCENKDASGLANVSLYLNTSSTFSRFTSQSISGTALNVTFTVSPPSASYAWNCRAEDTFGNAAFAGINRTIVIERRTLTITEKVIKNATAPSSEINITGRVNLSDLTYPKNAEIKIFINGTQLYNPGDGSDGALIVSGINTVLNNYTYLTNNATRGDINLSVADTSEFLGGDSVLIVQMQNDSGVGAGTFEIQKNVTILDSSTITLSTNLSNMYGTGIYGAVNSRVTQIVRIPQFTDVTISSGYITAPLWNGTIGGIAIFQANGTISFTGGNIIVNGTGFRGGGCGACGNADWGQNGEGITGIGSGGGVTQPTNWPNPDTGSNGGGGGYGPSGFSGEPGGGGGYASAGDIGIASGTGQNTNGGNAIGSTILSKIFFGGGGGGGGDDDGTTPQAFGGNGGGIIILFANKIINANLNASGTNGATDGGIGGEGGGGAGGTIWIHSSNTTFSSVNAYGGLGPTDGADNAGDGSEGRIRLDYNSFGGITPSPSAKHNGSLVTTYTNASGNYFYQTQVPSTEARYNVSVTAKINSLLNGTNWKWLLVDKTNPSVVINSINPNPAERITENVTINFTVFDLNLFSLYANVTYPNGTLLGQYTNNFTILSQLLMEVGNYTVTIFAIDRAKLSNITIQNFTVVDTTAPQNLNERNGSVTDVAAVIRWETDEVANSTVSWGITLSMGNITIDSTFETSHSIPLINLSSNTMYYYNITSCDPYNNCNTTGQFNFSTSANPDITAPQINNVTTTPTETSVSINWLTNEDSNSSVNYNTSINLGIYENDASFVTNHTMAFSGLTPLTLYYFNLTSCDLAENCNTTGQFNFTTLDITAPTVNLDYPPNSTNTSQTSFTFNFTVTDNVPLKITNCTLWHNKSGIWGPNVTLPNVSQGITTNITINLPSEFLVWNVLCEDSQGNAAFNATNYTLRVDYISPTEFNLTTPENNTRNNDLTPLFKWNITSEINFDRYDLELSETPDFTVINGSHSVSNISLGEFQIVDDLDTATNYYWRVTAYDTFNNSFTAGYHRYTTDSSPSVTLTTPQNGSLIGGNGTIKFSCQIIDDFDIVNISIQTNKTGSLQQDDFIATSGMSVQANFSVGGFNTGTYSWNCLATDSNNNTAFASSDFVFTTDSRFIIINATLIPNATNMVVNTTLNGSIVLSDGTPLPYEELTIKLNGTRINPKIINKTFLENRSIILDWWNSAYQFRQNLNLTNQDSQPLREGSTINFTFNTSKLINEGKMLANGSDFRIVYYNGSVNKEISRINLTQFNQEDTVIAFRLQKDMGIGESTGTYWIYYDYPTAETAPNNPLNVYLPIEVHMYQLNTSWTTINLNNTFMNPVIIAKITEANNTPQEVSSRIRNVGTNSFDIRLQNPGSNSFVNRNVTIIIVEEGTSEFLDGTLLEAHIQVNETQVVGDGTATTTTYTTVNYNRTYGSTPSVFAQVMTYQDNLWVSQHFINAGLGSVDIALEMGQYCQIGGACPNTEGHDPENIGWLIIERGVGNISGVEYEVGVTGNTITGVTDLPNCHTTAFSITWQYNPLVSHDLTTRNGGDGGWSGACGISTTVVGFHNQEEDESDSERNHAAETVNYVAIQQPGEYPIIRSHAAPTVTNLSEELGPSRTNNSGNFRYSFQTPNTDGIYLVWIGVNFSNVVSGSWEYNLVVDSTPPNITLLNPKNNSFVNEEVVNFTYFPTDISMIQNCSLQLDSKFNMTNYSISKNQNNSFIIQNIQEGVHNYSVSCVDSLNQTGYSLTNKFTVDRTSPSVNLVLPPTNANSSLTNILFNYTFIDTLSPNATCTLSVDDSSFEIATAYNDTVYGTSLNVSYGYRSWNVSCVDLAGNSFNSSNRNFTILSSPVELRIRVNSSGINLSWAVSEGATNYEVYISDNYSKGFGNTANFTTSSNSIYQNQFVFDRYYEVRAIRDNIVTNSTYTAGYSRVTIYDGLNLISNPLIYYPTDLKTASNDGYELYDTGCVKTIWKYNLSDQSLLRSDWDGVIFSPAIGSERFTYLDTNTSYWITGNSTCNTTFTGFVRTKNITSNIFQNINPVSYNRLESQRLPTNSNPKIVHDSPQNIIQAISRWNFSTQSFEVTVHYLVGGSPWGWFPSANNPNFINLETDKGYYFDSTSTGNLTQTN